MKDISDLLLSWCIVILFLAISAGMLVGGVTFLVTGTSPNDLPTLNKICEDGFYRFPCNGTSVPIYDINGSLLACEEEK